MFAAFSTGEGCKEDGVSVGEEVSIEWGQSSAFASAESGGYV